MIYLKKKCFQFLRNQPVKIIASKMLNWLVVENNIIPFHMNVNVVIITFSFIFIAHMAPNSFMLCVQRSEIA